MRITKVTTGVGDQGTTRLVGGDEVGKDDPRIEATGTVDELNATVGVVRSILLGAPTLAERLDPWLTTIQHDLFNVGSDLATPAASRWPGLYRIGDNDCERLEAWTEEINAELPPLAEFILPGPGRVGAQFHVMRTVCRRAERAVVRLLKADSEVGFGPMRYLNRLSDFAFVAGRLASAELGEPENLWKNPSTSGRAPA